MTAEVSVMNRLGVSLAADSAVTVGQELDKIYASAEKLFLVAENAPIGVMVYGDGEFLNVPWETVIKGYRRHLGQKTFLTLEEYANDFVHFLGDNRALFPASAQEEFVRSFIRGYYLFLRDQLKDRLDNELQNRKLAEKDIKRIFSDLVQGELEQTKKADLLHQLPTDFSKTIGDKYQATIASEKKQIFESYPMSRTTNARLTRLAEESISRQHWKGWFSGVVFAGFGENEYFPSLIELIVKGTAADQVLFWKNRTAVMGSDYPACIMAFAQWEMVATFMEGVDPQLKQMIESSTTTLFNGISQTVS